MGTLLRVTLFRPARTGDRRHRRPFPRILFPVAPRSIFKQLATVHNAGLQA